MTWKEWAEQFLVAERARKLNMVEHLSSGSVGTNRIVDGQRVDTTSETIEINRAHIAELEEILSEAGVTFDA